MQLVMGECLGVTRENREAGGSSWIETKIHVLDGVRTTETTCVKDFHGELPQRGDFIAIEVLVRAYPLKGGGVGTSLSALRRSPEVERAVAPVWAARVKASEAGKTPVSAVN